MFGEWWRNHSARHSSSITQAAISRHWSRNWIIKGLLKLCASQTVLPSTSIQTDTRSNDRRFTHDRTLAIPSCQFWAPGFVRWLMLGDVLAAKSTPGETRGHEIGDRFKATTLSWNVTFSMANTPLAFWKERKKRLRFQETDLAAITNEW